MAEGTEAEAPDTLCNLAYPERFYAAVLFAASPPPAAKAVTNETRLLLYALYQQATLGPCHESKPWGWNVVENAKWNSWKQLGDMASVEAMRLYIRTMEEENPDWWTLATDGGDPALVQEISEQAAQAAAAAGAARATSDDAAAVPPHAADAVPPADAASSPPPAPAAAAAASEPSAPPAPAAAAPATAALLQAEAGAWSAPFITGPTPLRRYDHAVASVGEQMYVVGGNCKGRYLSDVSSLNLRTLEWHRIDVVAPAVPTSTASPDSPPPPPPPPLPPCAAAAAVAWGSSVLLVGGLTKGGTPDSRLEVYALDTATRAWSKLEPTGDVPRARGGHSATLIGGALWVFGGEDSRQRLLGDVHVLDLATMTWSSPPTSGGVPAPRTRHTAAAFGERFLYVFGGGSQATFFNDVHVLDTATLTWSSPAVGGAAPAPRAGHAGGVLDGVWYVVGGGNLGGACLDTLALTLTDPAVAAPTWATCTTTEPRTALAAEGLSVLAVPASKCLVAFGGYDGGYHNSTHVLRAPLAVAGATAAATAAAVPAAPPPKPAAARAPPAPTPAKASAATEEVAAAAHKAAAAEAAAARDAASQEVLLMRRQLAAAQASLGEAERELASTRTALQNEQAKSMRIEAELAEATKKLESLATLEREAASLRKKLEVQQEPKGGGLWGYIAGTPANGDA